MSNDHAAVLSDVHIGNNANTCWYQSSVHEPYVVAALEWIVQNAGMFQEVILLGDLVDTWTYPPSVQPPGMADIITANPNVLGSNGALAKVVNAVPKVTFLLGNHDGTLTQADIATLQNAVGPIELVDPVHVLTGTSGARTAFSHGHYWTMFNAPDNTSPWDTLPVGHFVTRAFSYMMANTLPPGQTCADMANMGYPRRVQHHAVPAVAGAEHDPGHRRPAAGLCRDRRQHVRVTADRPPARRDHDDRRRQADLRRPLHPLGGQENGSVLNAARAALADGSGNYLAWFAQRLAIQQSADLVVFGHTHTPIGGLTISPINYYNSGFECASSPTIRPSSSRSRSSTWIRRLPRS